MLQSTPNAAAAPRLRGSSPTAATPVVATRAQTPLAAMPVAPHPCAAAAASGRSGTCLAPSNPYSHQGLGPGRHDPTGSSHSYNRRALLLRLASAGTVAGVAAAAAGTLVGPSRPAAALPLGPLGPVKRVGGDKRTGLTAEEVATVLRRDLAEGQYFVTGELTRDGGCSDNCRFVDPTNDVTGLSKYLTALGVLFDPQYSKVELLNIRVTDPRVIEADWRLGGYLAFPWNPRVEPFTGHTVYTLNEEGLVSEQRQTWSISGATALIESFTPSWGPRRQLF